MRNIIFSLFLFFTISSISQEIKYLSSLPVFNGCSIHTLDSERKSDIILKTLDFISEKTNETFLKRMNLKENDSIEFPIEYWVSKEGKIIKDSIKIDTPIISFNNYITLIINSLPKFIPAQDDNLENIDYKISFIGRFNVKDNQLKHFQYEIESDIESELKKPLDVQVIPTFKSCENFTDKVYCFNEQMNLHIKKHIIYPEKAKKKGIQGRVIVQFIIDEYGNVTEIKSKGLKILADEAYRIISLLPKFEPGYKNETPVRVKYGLPITFRLQK